MEIKLILLRYWLLLMIIFSVNGCRSVQPVVAQPAEPVSATEIIAVKDDPEIPAIQKRYRDTIRLGLVMPFYLADNFPESPAFDSVDIDSRSLAALQFYEGAMIAADSLRLAGTEVILHVQDNSRDTSAYQWMLMNYSWLKKNDFNYVQFASGQCDETAKAARRFHTPVIISQCNPLSSNLSELTAVNMPSTQTQCSLAVKFLIQKFPMHQFVVMARSSGRENELAAMFMDAFHEHPPITAMRVAPSDSVSWKMKITDSSLPVIFILSSSDEYFVTASLNSLESIGKKLTVVGLPTWDNFETILLGSFSNLDILCFSSNWIDYQNQELIRFRIRYLNQFKTDISWSAWQGYNLVFNLSRAVYSPFPHEVFKEIFQPLPSGGFENHSIHFIRYSGFDTIRLDDRD